MYLNLPALTPMIPPTKDFLGFFLFFERSREKNNETPRVYHWIINVSNDKEVIWGKICITSQTSFQILKWSLLLQLQSEAVKQGKSWSFRRLWSHTVNQSKLNKNTAEKTGYTNRTERRNLRDEAMFGKVCWMWESICTDAKQNPYNSFGVCVHRVDWL